MSPSQIRAARALIGAKQSDLARAAGVSLATLNNIERGVGDPRSSTLERIETALAGAGVEFADDAERETRTGRLEPSERRASSYGVLHAVVGLATLPAGIMAGVLWKLAGPGAAFGLSAAIGLVTAFLFISLIPEKMCPEP